MGLRAVESTMPLISVVIPTRKREQLVTRAVRSALAQTVSNIEVVVIIDGPDDSTFRTLREIDDRRLRIETPLQNLGACGARNAGASEARGKWIAFLDDDDEWLPEKLEIQLQTAEQSRHRYPIISCHLVGRSEFGDFVWPARMRRPGEELSEYLLCRKGLFWGEGVIQTSTIFTLKELLVKVPFSGKLRKHQDIDWLLRANNLEGVGVEFPGSPVPLVIWHMEKDRDRITNTPDWRHSLSWIRANNHLVTPRAYTCFLMTWVSSSASRQGEWNALPLLVREAWQKGTPTVLDVLIFFSRLLIPHEIQRRIAALFKRKNP